MPTCLDVALERLADRAIKPSTHTEYMSILRSLDLVDEPAESLNKAFLTARLQRTLHFNTRRKQAIALRSMFGIAIPCPRAQSKEYDLPTMQELHDLLDRSTYRSFGFSMLYAGLRLGEACIRQPLKGRTLNVDRQRLPSGEVSTAKTTGPVVVPQWLADEYKTYDFDRGHNTVYVGIRRAGKKAGIELTPHMLRHAFATNLVKAGAHPEVLRRQMRHHNVSVSLGFYVQTTVQDIEGVVDLL